MFILLLMLFAEIFANPIKPKLCCECKFFIKDFFTANKFGKCALFPKEEKEDDNMHFLVDGVKNNNKMEYSYCSISRKYPKMCGPEGTFYEPRR